MNIQICFMYFYGPRLNCFRPFLSNNSITWRLQEYSDTTQVGTLLTEFCEELVQADLLESYDSSSITGGSYSGHSYATINAVLKASSSESPDYTQILTDINSNLTDLNSKFVNNTNINICRMLESLYNCFNGSGPIESSDTKRASSYIRRILLSLCGTSSTSDTNIINGSVSVKASQLIAKLQQSVSPNASITDVISALNTTIDSKQNTTVVNNEVTPLAEINIDVPFEVKNLKKSDVENL